MVTLLTALTEFKMLTLLVLMMFTCGGETYYRGSKEFQWPRITATTASEESYVDNFGNTCLHCTIGEDIALSCTSNDIANFIIRYEERQIAAQNNSTTIQMTLTELDLGEHTFYCTDNHTGCTDTLNVRVNVAMTVTAPRVHRFGNRDLYFVPRGEVYKIFCSPQYEDDSLSIFRNTKFSFDDLEAFQANATTIFATVTNDTEGGTFYCRSSKPGTLNAIQVIVDYYPDAREFRCVIYYKQQFKCTWRSLSDKNTYKLFLSPSYGDMEICSDNSGASTCGCVRALNGELYSVIYSLYRDFSLQVQTCNQVFCSNQTFPIFSDSITKLNPVRDLKLHNSSSRGAVVTWGTDAWHGICEFKVEYKMLGMEWRQPNASSVQCYGLIDGTCKFPLTLPCPGAHYELRVYVRHKQATEDVYWSEPSTMYFFTAAGAGGDEDPLCDVMLREPRPVPSAAAVALHEVLELISDEREKKLKLTKLLSSLRRKKAQIEAFLATRT